MGDHPITPQGLERLKDDLQVKSAQMRQTSQDIEEARAMGDLSENFEYHAAKDRQGFLAAQIRDIKDRISRAEVIDPGRLEGDRVVFGATVVLAEVDSGDQRTYQIVGESESDVDGGRISVASPLARALIGREVGDEVQIPGRNKTRAVEIVDVRFG